MLTARAPRAGTPACGTPACGPPGWSTRARTAPAPGPEDGSPASPPQPALSPRRPVIESIRPLVDGGRFPAKAAVGDTVVVEADVFCDGHDLLACEIRHRHDGDEQGDGQWATVEMEPLGNDRWRGSFCVRRLGCHRFVVGAAVDGFATWRRDLLIWASADVTDGGQPLPPIEPLSSEVLSAELLSGADLLTRAASLADGADRQVLAAAADWLEEATDLGELLSFEASDAGGSDAGGSDSGDRLGISGAGARLGLSHDATVGDLVRSDHLHRLARQYLLEDMSTLSPPCLVVVEPERARFSTWYEMFPRSASPVPGRAGTLADVIDRLDYVARLGADVLYLPPIHPIGSTGRKGAEGSTVAGPDDPGSPWAIGSAEGGHTAVDPALGTLADFDALVAAAAGLGIDVALDLAFQCSPDHPWVSEHPEWFRRRPDGSIRFAENPPKRYEDIYPIDFDTDAWWELWQALLDVVRFWIGHGVTVFRVDNPHTKPFDFWEWLIATVKSERPEVIFLAEAFTRPKVMHRLAKLGFSQSYTYFAWRSSKWELESYLADLSQVRDFFRPNFWPNTPDILTATLQHGGTAAFVARLVLAATLAASYGIYGPAFELQEHIARSPGSEEYAGSEKYAVRHWDLDRPDNLAPLVSRVNEIRHAHPALQRDDTLRVHHTDNDQLLAYSKSAGSDEILVVVNLDPHWRQSGWVDLGRFAGRPGEPVEVHDLLTGARYRWEGSHGFVILDPEAVPAHVLEIAAATPATPATPATLR